MKYVIILPDGAADDPVPALGGLTPLAAARKPNIDWIASHGRVGRVVTVPAGFTPGTDVATLSLFGYDPQKYYSGRAPIEAAAKGLTVGPDEMVFRCNFVTVLEGRMQDFTAGHIAQPEADALIAVLNQQLGGESCRFYSGVSYRNLMIGPSAHGTGLRCTPPHDIPNQPVADHWPRGNGAQWVRGLMERAAGLFEDHAVNRQRRVAGRDSITGIWLWGQGRPTRLEPFQQRFGCAGVAITAVDIIRGLAVSVGLKTIDVPGATGYLDTDYAAKGAAAVGALADFDLVMVHIEAPDEAGHLGDPHAKTESLERIDEAIVGPLLDALRRHREWRIMVAPDHPTPVGTQAHSATPPPFCYAGTGVAAMNSLHFSEEAALASSVLIDPGFQLMEQFLRG